MTELAEGLELTASEQLTVGGLAGSNLKSLNRGSSEYTVTKQRV